VRLPVSAWSGQVMKTITCAALLTASLLAVSCSDTGGPKPSPKAGETQAVEGDRSFDSFYERFRKDEKFRIERTSFPVKATTYRSVGPAPDPKAQVRRLERDDVLSGKVRLYVNDDVVRRAGYVHAVSRRSETRVSVMIGAPNSDALVGYIFEKRAERWYLTELENYYGS
jgi:hypothetical protein